MQVIKPNNKVFHGHSLKQQQLSANVGQAIAARAIKCAKKPTIRFDYDHKWVHNTRSYTYRGSNVYCRSNCETFCNLILFNKPLTVQADDAVKPVKGKLTSLYSYEDITYYMEMFVTEHF